MPNYLKHSSQLFYIFAHTFFAQGYNHLPIVMGSNEFKYALLLLWLLNIVNLFPIMFGTEMNGK